MQDALALKYRPKVLEDVVGQPTIVRTLSNAIRKGTLHHAYLFVGQFGSGKTTVARIIAAAENCSVSPGLHPCGKCVICKAIFDGSHTDIEEIDAASGAGKVDQVRKMKENAMYKPVDGAIKKVFIIDECHSMSQASNDALLKLLEEPPSHVRFILCTTDIRKLRPAIQSRCQRHDFRKLYWSLMSEHLAMVAKSEKLKCETGALNLCARLAQGSMRNALNHLAKLMDFADGTEITTADAQKMFGEVSGFYDLFDQIIGIGDGDKPDASKAFLLVNGILSEGAEFSTIYEGLADHLRSLMVGLTSSRAGDFIHVSEEGKRRLQDQLTKCKKGQKLGAVLECMRCLHVAKSSVDANLPPEGSLQAWIVESIFAFRR